MMSDEGKRGARTGEYPALGLPEPDPVEPGQQPPATGAVESKAAPAARPQTPPVLGSVTREIRNGDLDRAMEFPDFMLQLGLHFQLPERPDVVTAMPSAPPVKRTRKWLVATAMVAVFGAGLASTPLLSRQPPAETAFPGEVLGEWKPSARKYAGRSFTLTDHRVRLAFGGELAAPVEFPVTEVRRSMRADTVIFEALYEQERGQTRFSFKFVDGVVPEIILSNPSNVIWRRDRDVLPVVQPDSSPVRGPSGAAPVRQDSVLPPP